MCVAIYKPKAAKLSRETLAKCFKTNPDGCGYALHVPNPPEGKKPYIFEDKGFFTFDEFWKAWQKYETGFDAIIHFRIATHGSVRQENCHPFVFKQIHQGTERQYAFAHNGVMNHFSNLATQLPGDKSDTRIFGERVLEGLAKSIGPNFMDDKRVMDYVEQRIPHNKVIVMRDDGHVKILNETLGWWIEQEGGKVWFSNRHWDFRPATPTPPPSSGNFTRVPIGDLMDGWHEPYGGTDEDDAAEQWMRILDRRRAERLKLREREDWVPCRADGYDDADSGNELAYPKDKNYVEGYFAVLERRSPDPLFHAGYLDSVNGNRARSLKAGVNAGTYLLGYNWAEFEANAIREDNSGLIQLVRSAPLPKNFQDEIIEAMEAQDCEMTQSEADNQAAANKAILASTGTPTNVRRH